jgi:hypothetical protein
MQGVLAVIQIWLDDSGKGQPPVFVLAAYAGGVEEWNSFAVEWQRILNQSPRLEYVKAYEAFGLRGQFKGWTENDRDDRLLNFVQVIKRYSRKGFAFTLRHEHFDKSKVSVYGFKNPYMFAYISALTGLLQLAKRIPTRDKIDIIFDKDVVHARQAKAAYKEFRRLPKEATQLLYRDEPRFEDDKRFKPLQAADLLAYCVRANTNPDPLYDRVRSSQIYERLMSGIVIQPLDNMLVGYREYVSKKLGPASRKPGPRRSVV